MSVIKYDDQNTAGTVTRDQLRRQYVGEELFNMSREQRELRLGIQQPSNSSVMQHLNNRKNKLMHSIRRKSLQLAETRLDQQAAEIEKQKDSAKHVQSCAPNEETEIYWAYGCWFVSAKCDRHKITMEILGIDMSKAFDTTHPDRLLIVLKSFLWVASWCNPKLHVRVGPRGCSRWGWCYRVALWKMAGASIHKLMYAVRHIWEDNVKLHTRG